MATTVQDIIDAATGTSLANDSAVTSDPTDLIRAVDRKVRQIYTQTGMPPDKGGSQTGDHFKVTWTANVATPNTTLVALPSTPEIAYLDIVTITSSGIEVSVVPYRDFLAGIADLAPAITLIDRKFRSCARTGDPAAATGLTFYGSYLPATLTLATHFIGATTATDSNTTTWPSHVGNPYLVAYLGWYMALKDGTRSPGELEAYAQDMNAAAQLLADYLGISAASLVTIQDTTDASRT